MAYNLGLVLSRVREEFRDLPQFAELDDYLYAVGTTTNAMLYASLIWPEFVVYRDMTFLAAFVAPAFRSDVDRVLMTSADLTGVEHQFNSLEIGDLFAPRGRPTAPDLLEDELAKVLSVSWAAKLSVDFPRVDHIVDLVDDPVGGLVIRVARRRQI